MAERATGILLHAAATLMLLGIIGFPAAASAAAFYVDGTNGNDSNPGSFEQPFRSIQKAAGTMAAGDTCYVRKGVYRETIIPAHSGRAGARITFKPYSNEQVTLSGADPITGWAPHQGSIYKAPIKWNLGQGNNQVFVDGRLVFEARWPNSTDLSRPNCLEMDSGSGWTNATEGVIRDPNLTQPEGTWNNAHIYMRPGKKWYARTARVTSSAPGSLTFKIHSPGHQSYEDIANYGGEYFITGSYAALDGPGEWFFDGSTLYLWAPDGGNPAGHAVEAKKRQNVVDLSDLSYINVEGFTIIAAAIKTNAATTYCIVDGVDASYVCHFFIISRGPYDQGNQDYTGFILHGSFNEICNSKIAWSAANGVTLQGSNNKVTNCLIHDVAYAGTDAAAINTAAAATSGHEITHNTLYNSGRSVLIHNDAENIKILYNHIYNAGLQMTDLGLTYAIATDGKGSEIAYNVVHGCAMSGIYLDNNHRNYNVHHNLVYDVRWALHLNRPAVNDNIMHNTIGPLRASGQALAGYPDTTTAQYRSDMTGTIIRNNVFRASSWDVATDPRPTMDHNIESSVDPLFADPANSNYQLRAGSPAIDAGSATPFSGEFNGSAPDCGAFEFGKPPWTAGYAEPAGNKPPKISAVGGRHVQENALLSFTVDVYDLEGDVFTCTAAGLPAGATFDAASLVFAWTPSSSQAGTWLITFTATDAAGSTPRPPRSPSAPSQSARASSSTSFPTQP